MTLCDVVHCIYIYVTQHRQTQHALDSLHSRCSRRHTPWCPHDSECKEAENSRCSTAAKHTHTHTHSVRKDTGRSEDTSPSQFSKPPEPPLRASRLPSDTSDFPARILTFLPSQRVKHPPCGCPTAATSPRWPVRPSLQGFCHRSEPPGQRRAPRHLTGISGRRERPYSTLSDHPERLPLSL